MFKSVLGALCICLGAYFSLLINNPIISPIVFMVGILLIIYFDLNLITREIPLNTKNTPESIQNTCVVLLLNVFTAFFVGLFLPKQALNLNPSFMNSILGGIVIGLVSLVAKYKKTYKEIIIIILMFCFVYLKLPHCVVYAFYSGIDFHNAIYLLPVISGNIIGGLLIKGINAKLRKNNIEY